MNQAIVMNSVDGIIPNEQTATDIKFHQSNEKLPSTNETSYKLNRIHINSVLAQNMDFPNQNPAINIPIWDNSEYQYNA